MNHTASIEQSTNVIDKNMATFPFIFPKPVCARSQLAFSAASILTQLSLMKSSAIQPQGAGSHPPPLPVAKAGKTI